MVKSGINTADDLLPLHCFRNGAGNYFDEYGNRLSGPVEPVGIYGLSGIGSIDDKIRKALGLPIKKDI